MLKVWAIFALMALIVESSTSDEKWAFYEGEYANKERRCSRGTSELGPHAYRGIQFQGPAWSVKFFFEDPQLIVESPWYNRIRREAPKDGDGEPVRLADILQEEMSTRLTRNVGANPQENMGDEDSEWHLTIPIKE